MWSQNVLQLDMSFLPHRLWLNDGERVPPGAVEPAAISRKMVANRRSKSKRHGYSREQGSQPGFGSRDETFRGGHCGWRADRCCVTRTQGGRHSAAFGNLQPAGQGRLTGMGAGRHCTLRRGPTGAGPAQSAAGPRCRREGEQRGCVGWRRCLRSPTSNRPRLPSPRWDTG